MIDSIKNYAVSYPEAFYWVVLFMGVSILRTFGVVLYKIIDNTHPDLFTEKGTKLVEITIQIGMAIIFISMFLIIGPSLNAQFFPVYASAILMAKISEVASETVINISEENLKAIKNVD